MIKCNLFSEKERMILQSAILKKINTIKTYTLQYKEGLEICGFIEMTFENDNNLVVTTGKLADNILVIDEFDFLNEKERYYLQDDVEIRVNTLSDFEISEDIKSQILLEVKCMQKPDDEYYCQISFVFEKKSLIINTLIDEIEFSVV